MVAKSWRRSAKWRGNIRTLYSPLSVRRSVTRLPLCFSRLLTGWVLFEAFTRGIGNWEAPSRAMSVPPEVDHAKEICDLLDPERYSPGGRLNPACPLTCEQ